MQLYKGGVQLFVDKITYNNTTDLCYTIPNVNRTNIDVMKLKAALSYYDDMIIKNLDDTNDDISVLLLCIDKVIKKCKFTNKQKNRLRMWMKGYTEKEIADYYNVSEVTIHNSLVVSCKKIAEKLKGELEVWF